VREVGAMRERRRTLRILKAAAVEASGMPGVYVRREAIMHRADVSNLEEFLVRARYLEGQGWIAEGVGGYESFVLTPEGIAEATKY
jgi:hypothetical protein